MFFAVERFQVSGSHPETRLLLVPTFTPIQRTLYPVRSRDLASARQQPSPQMESERRTRKSRIDPKLKALGWRVVPFDASTSLTALDGCAIEEYPTENGPADYALCLDGRILGVVEAKKLTLGPQNVLTQAERYSRGCSTSLLNYDGCRVPFLYSTNGEVIWFHDVRHQLSRSRKVNQFHTPAALREKLEHDLDVATDWLKTHANDHSWLRPYQIEANNAIEKAVADRKRLMLVAMATGTGKTFTLVNQVLATRRPEPIPSSLRDDCMRYHCSRPGLERPG
jgi:type I restriction enzyme R subunit